MSNVDFDTTKRLAFKVKAATSIAKLATSKAYKKPLEPPSCDPGDPAGLVTRSFRYKTRVLRVKCHAKVMVGLLKAMLKEPTIEVTADSESRFSGSYRTWDQQSNLYREYQNGTGHKAAHPCLGYHRQGRALDLLAATDAEKRAMSSVRMSGLRFYNGESFGDPPHWNLGILG